MKIKLQIYYEGNVFHVWSGVSDETNMKEHADVLRKIITEAEALSLATDPSCKDYIVLGKEVLQRAVFYIHEVKE